MLRFLHTADLHLGMRLTRFSHDTISRVREARFESLQQIRSEADRAEREYQFIIVAGDLFDDVRVPREIARRAFDLLDDFPIPLLVIPGNHDPCEPGAMWEMAPWNQPEPQRIRLLREREPFRDLPGVSIFPCPVFRKTAFEDPTAWIADYPRTADDGFRVGIAHGSVMDRPNLPEDDHPIAPDAPERLDLDYLALGHWHRPRRFCDDKMAYPGVHEPMRFSEDHASGWRPYSPGADRADFLDDGQGRVYSVSIDQPGSKPTIEEISVGRLRWVEREQQLTQEDEFARLIQEVADESRHPELTMLRLRLMGTLPLTAFERVDELRQVLGRYVHGELDDRDLHVEPTEDEIRDLVGAGILRSVFEEIQSLRNTAETAQRRTTAERAIKLLYNYAKQTRANG